MKAWWYRLSLHNKLQIPIQFTLLLLLVSAQFWVMGQFEQKALKDAEQRAVDSATQSFLGLNSMMLNGNIHDPQARQVYFKRMSSHDGVIDFHLVRGQPVQNQFGPGLAEEQARDELDRKALASNTTQIQQFPLRDGALRVVVPFAASHEFHGVDCLQCHHVREGDVNGAISLTISLEGGLAELRKMRTLLSVGQMLLQVSLFLLIGFLIRRSIEPVVKLEKTMLAIQADGDLSKRAKVESADEVGHIAQVFNDFVQNLSLLKQQLADKVTVLEAYRDRSEQEQRIAAGYMNKLIAQDKLRDPAVQFYLKPAENFSGDLIAIARTPDNRLHLMLADSTGHGLSAALAAMPMIHPFYSMTGKGFGISAIAREINAKIRQSLPVSHFVAAVLVSIDADAKMVEVWSGGCPPPFILNNTGECKYHFAPRHLAMGILPPEQFDASVEYFPYHDENASIVMFSDGVIELVNAQGEQFGRQRLLDAAHIGDVAARWNNLIRAIEFHGVAGHPDTDDITLIMAQFKSQAIAVHKRVETPAEQVRQEGEVLWQFALTLSVSQIKKLDVVPLLMDIVQQIENDKERGKDIFMILSEMFNNALDHGVLKLDSGMKQHADGMEAYFDERAARLANAVEGTIQLNLKKIFNSDGSTSLWIRVKDSGDGFDYHKLSSRMNDETRYHGRGIPLLYSVCRDVQFLGNGSELIVCFDIRNGKGA